MELRGMPPLPGAFQFCQSVRLVELSIVTWRRGRPEALGAEKLVELGVAEVWIHP